MLLLKGFIIGMLASLPIGPLGLLSIQRTLNKGWKVGFFSAVGAITSDAVYSSMAVLGLSFIDDLLKKHRHLISHATGVLFLIVGINILMSGIEKTRTKEVKEVETIHPFILHFLMGLSNPMTFIIFFAFFTRMGIYVIQKDFMQQIMFIVSIFIGSSTLWLIITNVIERSKKRYKFDSFIFIDKIIGTIIILFGVFSILKGIMR